MLYVPLPSVSTYMHGPGSLCLPWRNGPAQPGKLYQMASLPPGFKNTLVATAAEHFRQTGQRGKTGITDYPQHHNCCKSLRNSSFAGNAKTWESWDNVGFHMKIRKTEQQELIAFFRINLDLCRMFVLTISYHFNPKDSIQIGGKALKHCFSLNISSPGYCRWEGGRGGGGGSELVSHARGPQFTVPAFLLLQGRPDTQPGSLVLWDFCRKRQATPHSSKWQTCRTAPAAEKKVPQTTPGSLQPGLLIPGFPRADCLANLNNLRGTQGQEAGFQLPLP